MCCMLIGYNRFLVLYIQHSVVDAITYITPVQMAVGPEVLSVISVHMVQCHTNAHGTVSYQYTWYSVIPVHMLHCHTGAHGIVSYQCTCYSVIPVHMVQCHTGAHITSVD